MALTTVNSDGIKDDSIKNADIKSDAAIAGSKLAASTTSAAGSMSAADKTKLDAIEASADVTDAANVNAAGAVMNSDLATKGQVLIGDGSGDPTALSVGANTYVLTADSGEATGVKWAEVPAGYDDTAIRQDLSTIALQIAVETNRTAFNLTNSFVEHFQDDSKIATETNVDRDTSGKYVGTAGSPVSGTQVYTSGSNTFSIPSGASTAEVLIVAGGASGGRSPNVPSGGGGGGGIQWRNDYEFTAADISNGIVCVVGAGGLGVGDGETSFSGEDEGTGNDGGDSSFAGSAVTVIAKGGGAPGGYDSSDYQDARSGGSGGGGTWNGGVAGTGGAADTTTFTGWTKYGNAGGSNAVATGTVSAGGGGGAGGAGGDSSSTAGGNGGPGQLFANWTSYGSSGYFGAGGGGGCDNNKTPGTAQHGAGAGTDVAGNDGGNATANTGGGGGGCLHNGYNNLTYRGGNGGSGFIGIKWSGTPVNATGALIGSASTASSSRTKVSGVITYQDHTGTATLGTDLKVSFSCDNGSNWTALDATSGNYTAGADFSTGIKTAYLKEVTCTGGTQIKYKVEWANQSFGGKVTRLHGIGMNY